MRFSLSDPLSLEAWKHKNSIVMAVESRHLNNIFSPQLINNNRVMMINAADVNGSTYRNLNGCNGIGAGNGGLVCYGSFPMSGTTSTAETLFPMYNNSVIVDSTVKSVNTTPTTMKDDSGLTYNFPAAGSISRKRSRDVAGVNPVIAGYGNNLHRCNNNNTNSVISTGSLSFLGEDISSQLVLQQLDIDRLVSQHMERVRIEMEESRKRHSRKLIEAVEIGVMKRLRANDEEIEKIGKANYALEERVKSLYIENQIWRDLAQNHESTANALRTNLELVLSQLKSSTNTCFRLENDEDDAESCCGSNENEVVNREVRENRQVWRTIDKRAVVAQDKKVSSDEINNSTKKRMCRKCGKEESCVLLLPCRHLCLCTTCGSSVHTCPVCKSNSTASVHVNINNLVPMEK